VQVSFVCERLGVSVAEYWFRSRLDDDGKGGREKENGSPHTGYNMIEAVLQLALAISALGKCVVESNLYQESSFGIFYRTASTSRRRSHMQLCSLMLWPEALVVG
jgi:hypothetical protein